MALVLWRTKYDHIQNLCKLSIHHLKKSHAQNTKYRPDSILAPDSFKRSLYDLPI